MDRIEENIEIVKLSWHKSRRLSATDVMQFCRKHRLYCDEQHSRELTVLQMHLHSILMSGGDISDDQIAEVAEDIKAHSMTKLSADDIAAKLSGLTAIRYERPNKAEFMAKQPPGAQVLTDVTRLPGGGMVYSYHPVLTADQVADASERIKDAFALFALKNNMTKTQEEIAALEARKAAKWGDKEART